MNLISAMICLIIGYAFGCVQTAYIVGKAAGGVDIRNYGSGNAGTTNITRVIGLKAGLLVFAADVLKSALAFLICSLIFKGDSVFTGVSPLTGFYLPGMLGSLGAILGHNFPFYMKFRGGKGFACTIGIILCLDWRISLFLFLINFPIFIVTRYVSLVALIAVSLFVISVALSGYGLEIIVLSALFAASIFYLHKGNIVRLFNGTERKVSFGGKRLINKMNK